MDFGWQYKDLIDWASATVLAARRRADGRDGMSLPLFPHAALQEAFAALHKDLIDEDGPRISTMRNYRFAILQYRRKTNSSCAPKSRN